MNIIIYDVSYNYFMSVEKFLHYIHNSSFTLHMHCGMTFQIAAP